MVFSLWVGHFPGTMAEGKESLEEGDHHFFAGTLHDHAWKYNQVVGGLSFGISQSSGEDIGAEVHVSIGKEQPVTVRLVGRAPHRVNLAQPTRRQLGDVNDFQATAGLGSGDDSI